MAAIPAPSMEVAREIARYLRANPLACDTWEGIARWWLGSNPIPESELVATLKWMEDQGIIAARLAADGRVRYRRSEVGVAGEAALDRLLRD